MMAPMAADPRPAVPAGAPLDLEGAHREHYRSLVRLASLLLDDVGLCEEVVQDAFVKVWTRGPQMRDPERLPAYLRSAVLNGARSALRHRQVERRHLQRPRSEEHTSELQSLMRISYAVFCL